MNVLPVIAVILLLVAYLALASSRVVEALRRFHDNRFHGGLLVVMLLIPTILAGLPTAAENPQSFLIGLLAMAAYLAIPTLALLLKPNGERPLDVYDMVAILGLWVPLEPSLFLPGLDVALLPEVNVRLAEGFSLSIPELTAIPFGLLLFLVIRPTQGIGYTFRLRLRDLGYALIGLAGFMVVGLPFGVGTGFIRLNFAGFDPLTWLTWFLGIYFFNALPEELLFRGVIQNLIEQRFGRTWLTLGVAALIFGLSHANNETAYHLPPNWSYVVMATFAGVAYGWTWQKSGKITGSAITHTLVNFVWRVLFYQG